MASSLYADYVSSKDETKFAISRDVLDMWGQFDFSSDVSGLESGVIQKLDDLKWDKNADSGYPSFDFVLSKSGAIFDNFNTDWVHLFIQIIENKTFVLENNTALKTGLFLDSQTKKVQNAERYQNALLILRSVIQKEGSTNMWSEIKRLSTLMNEEQWESFKVVAMEFGEMANTKIADLDTKLAKIKAEPFVPEPGEIKELKAELVIVQENLRNVQLEVSAKNEVQINQKKLLNDLAADLEDYEASFANISEYLEGFDFETDNSNKVAETIQKLMKF